MNIQTIFKAPFESQPHIPKDYPLEAFIDPYTLVDDSDTQKDLFLFNVLAKGEAKVTSPWSFDMLPTSCSLFIYSKEGSGSIRVNGQTRLLPEASLLYFECSKKYKLQIESKMWNYQIYILSGNGLNSFSSLIPPEGILLTNVREPSLCYSYINQLESLCYQHQLRYRIQISDLVNRILTLSILSEQTEEYGEIPEYLDAIKLFLENEYSRVHSLDELEDRFHISKYKICHEFKECFHMPPLQYLNWRRIEAAKVLLMSTTYKIHEVGNMVGIENTNHFINLFKKYNHLTPLEYKRRMAQ